MTEHDANAELDATSALAAVRAQRAALADRVITPIWYHPILGLALFALFAVLTTHRSVLIFPVEFAVLAVELALAKSYQRMTGLWISGFRGTRPKRVLSVLLGVIVGLVLLAGLADLAGQRWAWVLAGAVACLAMVVLGRRYDEALREDLRESL